MSRIKLTSQKTKSHIDVISLTETWLNETVPDQDLAFSDFQIPFRRDRLPDNYGGIAVYVKHDIPCKLYIPNSVGHRKLHWNGIRYRHK